MKNIYQTKCNHTRAGVDTVILKKIYFKTKNVTEGKKRHFIMIVNVSRRYTIINIYIYLTSEPQTYETKTDRIEGRDRQFNSNS